jgi:signal transduction histidine kinase
VSTPELKGLLDSLAAAPGERERLELCNQLQEELDVLLRDRQVSQQEQTIQRLGSHDALQRLQAALAQAENHLEELKDPTAKSWSLRESAEGIVTAIELSGAVLRNLMQGDYLPEEYQFESLDLRELLMAAVTRALPLATRRSLHIHPRLAPEHMPIKLPASSLHLQQAFINLVHNAVKYSYRAVEPGVLIRGAYTEQGYQVTIANQGAGILPDEYERIFEPGYQGVLGREAGGGGLGLGLSLVQQVIEKHRGRIAVQSEAPDEPARGYRTQFTIWLPLTQPTPSGPLIRLVKGGAHAK